MPTSDSPAVRSRARRRSTRRRGRAALAGIASALLVGVTTVLVGLPAAASEEPSGSPDPTSTGDPAGPPIGEPVAGTQICTVSNPELDEITGMVAFDDVIFAVEGGTTSQPSSVEIWMINATTCEASVESYGFSPIDPQDLVLGADGELWVADIGLGFSDRERATMERVDIGSGTDAVPYRALFPPSGPVNGTAALLESDHTPIIFANSGQTALIYRPDGPVPADSQENLPTLEQVGEFTPINTDTSTPRGAFGRLVVTGAAMAPDRSKVVVRTESDAYEFTVEGDDIVASITGGTPVITRLPDEENGQAITYSADGTKFLTLSFGANPVLRSYQPYTPPAETPDGGEGGGAPTGGGGGRSISFGDITNIALVTGFLGLAAVVAGIIGIVRARRQYFAAHPEARKTGGRLRIPGSGGRVRPGSGPGRREPDDADEYGASRPSWPPRPRADERHPAPVGADDEYGAAPPAVGARPRGGSTYGAGPGPGPGGGGGGGGGGQVYGAGGTTYGSGGTPYGSGGAAPAGGGTTYGSGGGTTYGSGGGTTYGSGGQTPGRPAAPGGGGGGVYGRPRSERDGEEPPHAYGRDNVDL